MTIGELSPAETLQNSPTPEEVSPADYVPPYTLKTRGPFTLGRARACAALISEAEELEERVRLTRARFLEEFGELMPPELPCAGILRTMQMEATRYREMAELVDGGDDDYRPG